MRQDSRVFVGLIVLAFLGTLSLGIGSVFNVAAERRRLRSEAAERRHAALVARARQTEEEVRRLLDDRIESRLNGSTLGRPVKDPDPRDPVLLLVYDAEGQRIEPAAADLRRLEEVRRDLEPADALEFEVIARLLEAKDRDRARHRLDELAKDERPAAVRGRARFLRAGLEADPGLRRAQLAALVAEADPSWPTSDRWAVHEAALDDAWASDPGVERPMALEALLDAFAPLVRAETPFGRGLLAELSSRLRREGRVSAADRVDQALADAARLRHRLAAAPGEAPGLPLSAANETLDLPIAAGGAARARQVVDATGERRATVLALYDPGLDPSRGDLRGAPDGAASAADQVDLGRPFDRTVLVDGEPRQPDALPWQTLFSVALILFALIPLGLGTVMTMRAIRRDRESVAARSDFLAGIAHQLKTPVANLRLFVETLASGRVEDEGERRHMHEILMLEAERLGGQLDRVLALARLDARAEAGAATEPIDLLALLDELESRWREVAELQGVELAFQRPAELPGLHGDPRGLADAIDNVIGNAIEHTRSGGRVEVLIARRETGIELRVQDQGPGIPEDERERLFERFFRGSAARRRGSGTGLGLVIARAGVAAAGGTIALEKSDALGSTFLIRLPGV